jgi:hypothetical protein
MTTPIPQLPGTPVLYTMTPSDMALYGWSGDGIFGALVDDDVFHLTFTCERCRQNTHPVLINTAGFAFEECPTALTVVDPDDVTPG